MWGVVVKMINQSQLTTNSNNEILLKTYSNYAAKPLPCSAN